MIVVMAKTGATLKTAATPNGILDLEFAYNSTKTTAVTNAWAANNIVDNIAFVALHMVHIEKQFARRAIYCFANFACGFSLCSDRGKRGRNGYQYV